MLFTKNLEELTKDDVIAFCQKFNEGIRVEYKSNFDTNVKNKIPKIISSFANSYGGVLILGIKTENGVPVEPFEGFEKPQRSEIELTIEEKCLENIYPLLRSAVKVIDIEGTKNIFVVIEVQQSSIAPHAIENDTKMYIRTGNQSKPYDLADIKKIEMLLHKRNQSEKYVKEIEDKYDYFYRKVHNQLINDTVPQITVTIRPSFLQGSIFDLNTLFNTTKKVEINNDNYFQVGEGINRFDSGVFSYDINNEIKEHIFNYCGTFGDVITNQSLTKRRTDKLEWYIEFSEIVYIVGRHFLFSNQLYKNCNFFGDIIADILIKNVSMQAISFEGGWKEGKHLHSVQHEVNNTINSNSVYLQTKLDDTVTDLLYNVIWAFNQGYDSITPQRLYHYVKDVLIKNNVFIT